MTGKDNIDHNFTEKKERLNVKKEEKLLKANKKGSNAKIKIEEKIWAKKYTNV